MIIKRVRQKKNLISKILSVFKRSEPMYDAGSTGRRLRGWTPSISGPNSIILNGLSEIRNRSRDLTRKFPLMNGAYDTIASNIIGTGIRAISKAEPKEIRDLIKSTWDEWCGNCDIDGINDFAAILELAVKQRFEVGEIFIRHIPIETDDENEIPYKIQLIEAEQVPSNLNELASNGNNIIGGIEFDKNGKRVAYHIYENHPGDGILGGNTSTLTTRIPTNEIIHYYKQLRPGQVRGIPECFSSIIKARDAMEYDDSELVRKKTASLMAGFITSPNPESVIPGEEEEYITEDGSIEEMVSKLEPGSMITLAPGEDIKFSSPAESGASYEPFLKSTHRSLASGLQMTYEEFTGDLSGVNFSSIRAGLNQSQRKYKKEQARIINMVCKPIWKKFFENAVLAGVFEFKGYFDNKKVYTKVQWQPPGFAYVNPAQEISAIKEKMKSGLISRSQAAAEMGYDIEEIDELIKQDIDRETKYNLAFDINLKNNPI